MEKIDEITKNKIIKIEYINPEPKLIGKPKLLCYSTWEVSTGKGSLLQSIKFGGILCTYLQKCAK